MQEPYEEYEPPVKDPRTPEEIARGRAEAQEMCRKMNELSRKNSDGLIQWLKDSGQIPDDDEKPEDFIENKEKK